MSDIFLLNNRFFNKHQSNFNISDEEKNENDSLSDENEDLYTKTKYPKKFIDIKDGEAELFQKYKNKNWIVNNTNTNFRRKINSKNNKSNINLQFNKTNHVINHINFDDLNNNRNHDEYNNKNKPIRLKYNNKKQEKNEIEKQIFDNYNDIKKENEYDIYNLNNKEKIIEEKINKFKTKFYFKGKNEDFIKYLNIVKIKAEIISLIEILINNGEKINKDNAEECFYKLENFIDLKYKEKRNVLKVYQYLANKLLEINNLNINDII